MQLTAVLVLRSWTTAPLRRSQMRSPCRVPTNMSVVRDEEEGVLATEPAAQPDWSNFSAAAGVFRCSLSTICAQLAQHYCCVSIHRVGSCLSA